MVSTFNDRKPTLFLHSCCGPCSTQVIDFLKDYFIITVYYYNPNIEPIEEYEKRKHEQIKFINLFNEIHSEHINFVDCDYDNNSYINSIVGLENELEGGARCNKCFYLRLKQTALTAKEKKYDYFGTTLTVSPHKNSQVINKIGENISKELNIPYIYGDFKKNDGYKKSIEFSKKYNLYRQDYCGCHFSFRNNNLE